MPKKKQKQKLYLTNLIGLLNLAAAFLALFALFFGIFNADGLEAAVYPGLFLVAFAICAYFVRAKFLGYKFSVAMNSFMIGMPIAVILLSIWGITSFL